MISIELLNKVNAQLKEIDSKYGKFTSLHEGYGVMMEEIRELEIEIFKKVRDFDRLEAECIDVLCVLFRLYKTIKEKNAR